MPRASEARREESLPGYKWHGEVVPVMRAIRNGIRMRTVLPACSWQCGAAIRPSRHAFCRSRGARVAASPAGTRRSRHPALPRALRASPGTRRQSAPVRYYQQKGGARRHYPSDGETEVRLPREIRYARRNMPSRAGRGSIPHTYVHPGYKTTAVQHAASAAK